MLLRSPCGVITGGRTGARFLLCKLVDEHADPGKVHQLRRDEEVVVVLNCEPEEQEHLWKGREASVQTEARQLTSGVMRWGSNSANRH